MINENDKRNDDLVSMGSTLSQHNSQGLGKCSCGGHGDGKCPTCSGKVDTQVHVYAIGKLTSRIPNLGLEKEIAQATGYKSTQNGTYDAALLKILSSKEFEYITREICYSFTIESFDTYAIKITDSFTQKLIIDSLRPPKGNDDIDVIIGRTQGKSECNGVILTAVIPSQIYSFDRNSFSKSITKSKEIDEKIFEEAIRQTFDIASRISGNYGVSDGHRAVNYIITRYYQLYELVAHQLLDGSRLISITTRPSLQRGGRRIIEIILNFQNWKSGVQNSFSLRVDVTDLYPFLVSSVNPYIAYN